MLTVYGIRNCSTMKKAFDWLAAQDLDFEFVDYKRPGVVAAQVDAWIAAVGIEPLLNTRGTTWRRLPEAQRSAPHDAAAARALMIEFPTLIKRPLVVRDGQLVCVGFDAATLAARLGS